MREMDLGRRKMDDEYVNMKKTCASLDAQVFFCGRSNISAMPKF
jgi:hypothetical protein